MLNLATKFRPSPESFELAFNAGFRCAELYLDRQVLEQCDEVIEMAKQWDMKYAMHFPNKPNLEQSHLEACAELFAQLNASAIVMHPPMMRRFADSLKTISSELVLAIETMRVPKDELVSWVSENGAVTIDVEHVWQFTLPGAPLEDFFQLLRQVFESNGQCVHHIHMPGFLPGQGEHRPMYTSREFCRGVFDILADHNYSGLVVSEVDIPFQNRFDLRMDVLLYEAWLEERLTRTIAT